MKLCCRFRSVVYSVMKTEIISLNKEFSEWGQEPISYDKVSEMGKRGRWGKKVKQMKGNTDLCHRSLVPLPLCCFACIAPEDWDLGWSVEPQWDDWPGQQQPEHLLQPLRCPLQLTGWCQAVCIRPETTTTVCWSTMWVELSELLR